MSDVLARQYPFIPIFRVRHPEQAGERERYVVLLELSRSGLERERQRLHNPGDWASLRPARPDDQYVLAYGDRDSAGLPIVMVYRARARDLSASAAAEYEALLHEPAPWFNPEQTIGQANLARIAATPHGHSVELQSEIEISDAAATKDGRIFVAPPAPPSIRTRATNRLAQIFLPPILSLEIVHANNAVPAPEERPEALSTLMVLAQMRANAYLGPGFPRRRPAKPA